MRNHGLRRPNFRVGVRGGVGLRHGSGIVAGNRVLADWGHSDDTFAVADLGSGIRTLAAIGTPGRIDLHERLRRASSSGFV